MFSEDQLPPVTRIERVVVAPPESLLHCDPDVKIPEDEVLETWQQRALAVAYARTWFAGNDCRQTLEAVWCFVQRATGRPATGCPIPDDAILAREPE